MRQPFAIRYCSKISKDVIIFDLRLGLDLFAYTKIDDIYTSDVDWHLE